MRSLRATALSLEKDGYGQYADDYSSSLVARNALAQRGSSAGSDCEWLENLQRDRFPGICFP
jgi:hypothetical protein